MNSGRICGGFHPGFFFANVCKMPEKYWIVKLEFEVLSNCLCRDRPHLRAKSRATPGCAPKRRCGGSRTVRKDFGPQWAKILTITVVIRKIRPSRSDFSADRPGGRSLQWCLRYPSNSNLSHTIITYHSIFFSFGKGGVVKSQKNCYHNPKGWDIYDL